LLARGDVSDPVYLERVFSDQKLAPREHVGWAGLTANIAKCHNFRGEHQQAKRMCEDALRLVTDADRDYAAHFAPLDLELATADAALGHFEEAFVRVDALLARFGQCDHPLVLGSIHATRAQIAHEAGDVGGYERHLAEAERWFRSTQHPSLIARCVRLRELGDSREAGQRAVPMDLREENAETTIITPGANESATVTLRAGSATITAHDEGATVTHLGTQQTTPSEPSSGVQKNGTS
jgi:hypothetical protein